MPTYPITRYFSSRKRGRASSYSTATASKRRRVQSTSQRFKRGKRRQQSRRYSKPVRRRFRRYRRRLRPVSVRSAIKLNDRLQLPQTFTTDVANSETVPTLTPGNGKPCVWLTSSSASAPVHNTMYCMQHLRTMCYQIWGTSSGNFNYRLLINSCERLETLSNSSNSPAHITMYRVVVRKNVPSSLFSSWLDIYGSGLYEKENTTYSALNQSSGVRMDRFTLFDSNKFCSYFKVVGSQKFQLDGGHQRYFKSYGGYRNVNMEMLLRGGDASTFLDATAFYSYIQGEMFNVYKISGIPAGVVSTANSITYSTPKVMLTTQTKYIYRQHSDVLAKNFTQLSSGYIGTSGAQPSFIEDDSGAVVTQTNIS